MQKFVGEITGRIEEFNERRAFNGRRGQTYYQDVKLDSGQVVTLVNRFQLGEWARGKQLTLIAKDGKYNDAVRDDHGRIKAYKGATVTINGKPLPSEAPGGEPTQSGSPMKPQRTENKMTQSGKTKQEIVAHLVECQKIAAGLAVDAAAIIGCKISELPEGLLITGNQVVMAFRDAGIILEGSEMASPEEEYHAERQAEAEEPVLTDDDIPF